MSEEYSIKQAVKIVEEYVEKMYRLKFGEALRPPPIDLFKAAAIAQITRKLDARAVELEEDWAHFTRD